jgi:hypothetical protein
MMWCNGWTKFKNMLKVATGIIEGSFVTTNLRSETKMNCGVRILDSFRN